MKKFVLWTIGFSVTAVIFATVASAEEGLKEGKWTMTMTSKVEGLPPEVSAAMDKLGGQGHSDLQNGKEGVSVSTGYGSMQIPVTTGNANMPAGMEAHADWNAQGMTMTVTQCVTNKNAIPDTKMPPGCERTVQRNGNTFNYHVTCNKPDYQMEQTGEVTYSGDTMKGLIKSHQTVHDRSIDSTIQITGQYIGPCQ